ncbi:hypothetical protein BDV93DRAFT_78987, partial [Ceratobasidium sp. AG-I]
MFSVLSSNSGPLPSVSPSTTPLVLHCQAHPHHPASASPDQGCRHPSLDRPCACVNHHTDHSFF